MLYDIKAGCDYALENLQLIRVLPLEIVCFLETMCF